MRITQPTEIIIFGVGGVGSWLAEWLIKQNTKEQFISTLTIVDHDIVEHRNLERQNYSPEDVGQLKVSALKDKLRCYARAKIIAIAQEIKKPEQLLKFSEDAIAVITTDNQESKNMIAKHFKKFIIGNCDYDYSEVKTRLDSSDLNTWTLNNGYTSAQDIQSNIRTAQMILTTILEKRLYHGGEYRTSVQTEDWTRQRIETKTEETVSEPEL